MCSNIFWLFLKEYYFPFELMGKNCLQITCEYLITRLSTFDQRRKCIHVLMKTCLITKFWFKLSKYDLHCPFPNMYYIFPGSNIKERLQNYPRFKFSIKNISNYHDIYVYTS